MLRHATDSWQSSYSTYTAPLIRARHTHAERMVFLASVSAPRICEKIDKENRDSRRDDRFARGHRASGVVIRGLLLLDGLEARLEGPAVGVWRLPRFFGTPSARQSGQEFRPSVSH